jgi:hypothetical protein
VSSIISINGNTSTTTSLITDVAEFDWGMIDPANVVEQGLNVSYQDASGSPRQRHDQPDGWTCCDRGGGNQRHDHEQQGASDFDCPAHPRGRRRNRYQPTRLVGRKRFVRSHG